MNSSNIVAASSSSEPNEVEYHTNLAEQLDLICSTKVTEAWVEKLRWEGLIGFLSKDRTQIYCDGDTSFTKGFFKSYKNLHFCWILEAEHFVPVDQPCVALKMVGDITRSPVSSL